jgi:uncharacterized caspase-like protein
MKNNHYKSAVLFLGLLISGNLFAQQTASRHALVIGNNNYQNEVSPLTNPANDAEDIAGAIREMGYEVVLKKNVTLSEMMNAIDDFTSKLSRDAESEGFFWFAGHGISVKDQHFLLPTDVNPESDNMISRSSYSVDELMGEIEKAHNKTNLIVIDACRNKLLPGNSSRSRSVGSRGLAVLALDDARIKGNKIVYSTAAGKTADDGVAGSRNSPFAEAFLHNIKSPQTFDDAFIDISQETLRLTRGEQEPYSMGTFAVKSYSLNPAGRQQITQVSAEAQGAQQALQVGAVSVAQGSLNISTTEAGQLTISINGIPYDFGSLPGYATLPVTNVSAGEHQAVMRYSDGHVEQKTISVVRDKTTNVDFEYKVRPALVPNTPAANQTNDQTNDREAWKNQRLYFGFIGGGGAYSWEKETHNYHSNYYSGGYYSWDYSEESMGFGVAGLMLQVQLWKNFALELDAGIGVAEIVLPVLPLMGVFTFRPSIFEIGLGAGYVIGLSAGFKISAGVKLGPGVFFAEFLGIMGSEATNDGFVSTSLIGYKWGFIDR